MQDIDRNREVFTKIWNIYKTYGEPKTDEEWDLLIGKMSEMYKQYETELCRELVQVVMNLIERESKNESNN